MAKNNVLPNPVQVSILVATATLAYVVTRFIDDPPQIITFQLPNFYFSMTISVQTIIATLIAGMMATGNYWLIHDHPRLESGQSWHHIWLPALTTWATSTLLNMVSIQGFTWWIVLFLGSILLIGVLVAEYISVDKTDLYYPVAAVALTVLSFCIYSAIILTWHNASYRLFIMLPAAFFATGILAMRILDLNIPAPAVFSSAGCLALIAAHISASLHYIPLTSIQYTLVNIGFVYSSFSIAINIHRQVKTLRIFIEPLTTMTVFLLSAWLIR